jgi:hypothetical protein
MKLSWFNNAGRSSLTALLAGAVVVIVAASAGHSAPYDGTNFPAGGGKAATPAEERFADAPDGVDPVVTGPVSAAFKSVRKAAGCDAATWPNVPMPCYPD